MVANGRSVYACGKKQARSEVSDSDKGDDELPPTDNEGLVRLISTA